MRQKNVLPKNTVYRNRKIMNEDGELLSECIVYKNHYSDALSWKLVEASVANFWDEENSTNNQEIKILKEWLKKFNNAKTVSEWYAIVDNLRDKINELESK